MYLLQVLNNTVSSETLVGFSEIFTKLSLRIVIDVLAIFILVRLIYYKIYKQREYFFTFFIFNLIIFFMCFFLNKVELSMGAAFGLFAVFSMLRYRTEDISIKDMTYLFLVIAIGLICAVMPDPAEIAKYHLDKIGVKKGDVNEILKSGAATEAARRTQYLYEFLFVGSVNAFILLITWLMETNILMKRELAKTIMYENIELIKPEREKELLENLKERTGLHIHRYAILKIDFLRDMATLKIYYHENKNGKGNVRAE
ncbi:MAG: DUF4956 domain-containing protein [Bacteroidia bacterium]|nr:DUF4956 domain-containing protein [Bacteroidia bacterium]